MPCAGPHNPLELPPEFLRISAVLCQISLMSECSDGGTSERGRLPEVISLSAAPESRNLAKLPKPKRKLHWDIHKGPVGVDNQIASGRAQNLKTKQKARARRTKKRTQSFTTRAKGCQNGVQKTFPTLSEPLCKSDAKKTLGN